MTVEELINKLQKCNPSARVYTEQYNDSRVNKIGTVKAYDYDKSDVVYLADDLCAVECDLKYDGFKIEEVK